MPNFDTVNRRLLAELQRNARQTNRELARIIGTAESTCLERVRLLHADGVITGHHSEVDLPALGRPVQAIIGVRLQPKTRAAVDEFRVLALALPETIAAFHTAGAEDFLVHVAVPGTGELDSLVLDRLAAHWAVADLRTTLVYEHARRRPVEPLL
ncbi:Lrp/AsnC family transcriptional regulator [Catenuloplanes indicus]|uniref:DNA-binding Lrp family transcriptional regulator n=1 Tax=Catenuloplanes indicus TaxID=137267 RepID=A0AAE4AXB5_9ACTN|nr:Lrp/AsnC family transcriptional regulator [Catenuloplanes indicus]MDQ0365596.1 DNA-binding Lrp family transcriptional regulator [Catenuloplanes indicus]